MAALDNRNFCIGSQQFDPLQCVKDKIKQRQIVQLLFQNDLFGAICLLFDLDKSDTYVYHAVASVQLHQVQRIVNMGGLNGLHDWYFNGSGEPNQPPPQLDIDAYVSIFKPQTTTDAALRSFHNSAKRASLRAAVASHLLEKRYLHSDWKGALTVKKSNSDTPYNPSFDFWEWSCHSLEWVGPVAASESLRSSHHVLPVLMHHFGCVVPSHESLQIIKEVAGSCPIVDVGSGNGYWTFMLRSYGMTVQPVDSMQSEWRVNWVKDTAVCDSVEWLNQNNGGRDMVLLMVYPIVGDGTDGAQDGAFTRNTLAAFSGGVIIIAGTQNGNGYTGFKTQTMDVFMAKQYPDWSQIAQIALPSFAGKDEALYIFRRS